MSRRVRLSRRVSVAAVVLGAGGSALPGAQGAREPLRSAATSATYANVDVSRAPGPQAEVRIAADPRSPSRLLAASNSDDDPGMRVYGSDDAGHTWSSDVLPSPPGSAGAPCHADPAAAIDGEGYEHVAIIQ